MMRSLWTAASGMIAQQTNVDNIANNLANVNTTGFKKQTTQFQSLLYSKLQTKQTDHEGQPLPVIAQVGSGTKVSGLVSRFTQGNLTETGNQFDMAIDGGGFFMVQLPNGEIGYTREGAFNMSIGVDGPALSNSAGYPVLSTTGEPIVLPKLTDPETGEQYDMDVIKVTVDSEGNLCYPDENNNPAPIGIQIGLVQFNNPSGLEKRSNSVFTESENSGVPRYEVSDGGLKRSAIRTRYLEASNVQTVDEVVNLIVAQRAYEMNSKAIQASDEMLQQANNLRS